MHRPGHRKITGEKYGVGLLPPLSQLAISLLLAVLFEGNLSREIG
jgi:hypothetical protein